MELAEMNLSPASLNVGMILDKYQVFNSKQSYFAMDVEHDSLKNVDFNINKYIAYNYFKMGINYNKTKAESMLKLGDYNYYGF
jgi:hypothetical protein